MMRPLQQWHLLVLLLICVYASLLHVSSSYKMQCLLRV